MAIKSKAPWWLVFVAALLGVGQVNAALLYHISIDTTSVSIEDGVMYFDLTNGDSTVDHSVTISAFASSGTLVVPPVLDPSDADVTGYITGTLPGPVSMADSGASPIIITYSQGVTTLGATIAFDFRIFGDTSPAAPEAADGFIFSLFSSGGEPLLSNEGVLFVYSIGEEDPLQTFSDAVTFSVEQVSEVPEPGAPALLMAGLLALGLARSVRNTPTRKMLTA